MNYQSGMMVKGEDKPCTNAVVYATEKEAHEAGKELLSRWFVPYDHTVVTTDDQSTIVSTLKSIVQNL